MAVAVKSIWSRLRVVLPLEVTGASEPVFKVFHRSKGQRTLLVVLRLLGWMVIPGSEPVSKVF